MVTIGDVFSVVAALVGICLTAWALILTISLLFQSSSWRARDAYRRSPWKGLGVGLLLTLFIGIASIVLLKMPIPLAKLAGTVLYLILMSVAALGASGISMLIGERISSLDPNLSRFSALARGAGLLVVGAVFPLLGWFLVGPVLLVGSVGFGFLSLVGAAQPETIAPPIQR